MKIGLLVPSRERLNLKFTLINSIIATADNIDNVTLYFGIDEDDPTRDIVWKIADAIQFVRRVDIKNEGKFIGINRIWNDIAFWCEDDIFGYIGDDMIFQTPGWDTKIIQEFEEGNCPEDNIKMVHCNDGFRGDAISVNAFVHRKYYEVMGYFTRPEFLINWSDQWMWQSFKAFDRIKYIDDIMIYHNHWVFGGRNRDKTADRMLSDNHDKISDKLWYELTPERVKDVKKLAEYLNLTPEWKYVDNTLPDGTRMKIE